MNESELDRLIWSSLNSVHRHLAIKNRLAARYPAEMFQAAAVRETTPSAFNELKKLVEVGEMIYLSGDIPEGVEGWEVESSVHVPQMVGGDFEKRPGVDAHLLTVEDVPEMLELVALAQPGPFLPRTIEMGHYYGLRQDGQLVAMAGERIHLTGWCEISAVCTHPEYRGRGYGGALTRLVAEGILARGETPFLHVAAWNEVAIKLYQKTGFRLRTEIVLNELIRRS
jgi:ribosomal protein S18 acetylase RimI-like enzyme